MSRPLRASIFRSHGKTDSPFSDTRRSRFKGFSGGTATRAGAFLALFAVIGTVFYAGTTSAASPSSPGAGRSSQAAASRPEALYNSGAWLLPSMMFQPQPSLAESVNTYAADCSTPKTDFNLGETV